MRQGRDAWLYLYMYGAYSSDMCKIRGKSPTRSFDVYPRFWRIDSATVT